MGETTTKSQIQQLRETIDSFRFGTPIDEYNLWKTFDLLMYTMLGQKITVNPDEGQPVATSLKKIEMVFDRPGHPRAIRLQFDKDIAAYERPSDEGKMRALLIGHSLNSGGFFGDSNMKMSKENGIRKFYLRDVLYSDNPNPFQFPFNVRIAVEKA